MSIEMLVLIRIIAIGIMFLAAGFLGGWSTAQVVHFIKRITGREK